MRPAPSAVFLWALYLGAALLVYGRAAGFPFLLDDDYHLVRNPTVQTLAGLPAIWSTNYWEGFGQGGLYRPLLKSLWALELALARGLGLDPRAVVLLFGLAVHALGATLVQALARRAGVGAALALAAGAVFLLHAAHTETIVTGVGQGETVSLALALGAVLLGLARKGGPLARAAFLACALAAPLVKEQGFALLPAAGLALLLGGAAQRRARAWTVAALAGGAAALLALRHGVLGGFGPAGEYTVAPGLGLLERAPIVPWLAGRYATLAAWPARLSPDHAWLQDGLPPAWSDPHLALGAALLLASALAAALLARRARRSESARLAGLFLLLTWLPLLPVLGLLPIGSVFAERHAYHALAGLTLLGALGLARTRVPARAAVPLLVAMAAALGVRAARQVPRWESMPALWSATLAEHPESWFAAVSLAYHHRQLGEWDEVRRFAAYALERNPRCHAAQLELGHAELRTGHAAQALLHYERAARSPLYAYDARANRILALLQLGRRAEAAALHAELTAERPGDPWLQRLEAALRSPPRGGG